MNRNYDRTALINIKAQLPPNSDGLPKKVIDLCDQLLDTALVNDKKPSANGFTNAEKHVMRLSAELWNEFIALPEQHESDKIDFCVAIHALQRIIGWRPMMRDGIMKMEDK